LLYKKSFILNSQFKKTTLIEELEGYCYENDYALRIIRRQGRQNSCQVLSDQDRCAKIDLSYDYRFVCQAERVVYDFEISFHNCEWEKKIFDRPTL
jgi:hypothetical protein